MTNLPQDDLPVDMWLHVATDALARYVAGGGEVIIVANEQGMVISLPGVPLNDPRLAPTFGPRLIIDYDTPAPTP